MPSVRKAASGAGSDKTHSDPRFGFRFSSSPRCCCCRCAGSIYSRGGRAEATGPIAIPPTLTLEGSEGVVLRLGADGKAYTLLLFTGAWAGAVVADDCFALKGEIPLSVRCSTVMLLADACCRV